jgi:hypothetical protein
VTISIGRPDANGRQSKLRFVRVRLSAPAARLSRLSDFYGRELGLDSPTRTAREAAFTVGETALTFVARRGEPFYHFALLVPGDRFAAALEWARRRTRLLPNRRSGEVVFDFRVWNAQACYFHDPGGSIVELIAHSGIGERGTKGDFRAGELLGISELGLVGDPVAMAEILSSTLRLELWDGTLTAPGRLAFLGERARTLILTDPGRGWLPTGRAAEVHEVEAVLSGPPEAEAFVEGSRYRISRRDE